MVQLAHRAMIPRVSDEDIRSKLSGAPSMFPRPTPTNIRAFWYFLCLKLTSIRSLQSASYGYIEMVEQLEVYALTVEQPWADFVDSGYVQPQADGSLTSAQQSDVKAIWTAAQSVYSSKIAIHTAVTDALNNTVPEGYKSTSQLIGAKVYRSDNCPRTILDNL